MTKGKVLDEVYQERTLQDRKWGEQNHLSVSPWAFPFDYMAPPESYLKERCERRKATGSIAWADILIEEVAEAISSACGKDSTGLRAELIQVAAVAVAWVECMDRNAQ
jgi:hypothetical protein